MVDNYRGSSLCPEIQNIQSHHIVGEGRDKATSANEYRGDHYELVLLQRMLASGSRGRRRFVKDEGHHKVIFQTYPNKQRPKLLLLLTITLQRNENVPSVVIDCIRATCISFASHPSTTLALLCNGMGIPLNSDFANCLCKPLTPPP